MYLCTRLVTGGDSAHGVCRPMMAGRKSLFGQVRSFGDVWYQVG